MKYLFYLISFLSTITLNAQDETRHFEKFTGIDVAGNISLNIYKGDSKADITILKGKLENLETELKNDILYVKFKNKLRNLGNIGKAEIDIYTNDLNYLEASAGSSAKVISSYSCDNMEIDASSGSSIKLTTEANSVKMDVSSGASVDIEGETESLKIKASSGGSSNAKLLEAEIVDVKTSSGANAKVWATEKLVAKTSSGGSVRHRGNPATKEIDAAKYSGGSVKKM